jgi:tetratricopeptide (TPR) repeat protein
MAFAGKSKLEEAKQELEILQSLMSETVLFEPFTPFSPAINGATVASKLLSGTIALKEKNINTAIIDLSEAVYVEQNMIYNEPRDWLLNTYPYLAMAKIADGDWYNAEKDFKEDLKQNNENGWSLYGLYQCYVKAKKPAEASKAMTRHKTAFAKADIKIASAVY